MAPGYNQPSVEPIVEDSEDGSPSRSRGDIRTSRGRSGDPSISSSFQKYHISERESNDRMLLPPNRSSNSKTKSKRSHKSTSHSSSTVSSKHGSRSKVKSQPYGSSSSAMAQDRDLYSPSQERHRRTHPGHSASSGESSDSDREEPTRDHRQIIAATRGRLTSPSVISVGTSLTTATNTSSSSSGSNSTVTQASISKGTIGKRPEGEPALPSPAVPDPPDVFAYMESDSIPEPFVPFAPFTLPSLIPHDVMQSRHASTSSASSSLHSDNASEQAADVDTDRSTSPERSVKGEEQRPDNDRNDRNDHNDRNNWNATASRENEEHSSNANTKYQAQLQAANERQSLHERRTGPTSSQNHPRIHHQQYQAPNPPISQALTPRAQAPPQSQSIPPMPQIERIPPTGYNLIAQNISGPTRTFPPIYRRFEVLNHRILLSLQDEIAELEDELRKWDDWDTNARSRDVSEIITVPRRDPIRPLSPSSSPPSSSIGSHGSSNIGSIRDHNEYTTQIKRHILPASRRNDFHYPTELSYPRTQLLQTLQYKLAQYNAHLKTFDDTSRLERPISGEVEGYRNFLKWQQPLVDVESRYLDESQEKDLVIIGGNGGGGTLSTYFTRKSSSDEDSLVPMRHFRKETSSISDMSERGPRNESVNMVIDKTRIPLPTLATALAAAFLVPILTFSIIPNWLGRMTVVFLVGLGVWGGLWQSLALGGGEMAKELMIGNDLMVVAGVYGAVMAIVAAVIA